MDRCECGSCKEVRAPWGYYPDTVDRSDLLPSIQTKIPTRPIILHNKEEFIAALKKSHHGQDCIVCFEKVCVCSPR